MPHEKQLLTEAAETTGATLSQWARKVCLAAAGAAATEAKNGEALILEQLAELKKLIRGGGHA